MQVCTTVSGNTEVIASGNHEDVRGRRDQHAWAGQAFARSHLAGLHQQVYGDPHVSPQTEDYRGLVNIAGPRACYDEGKRWLETLFYDYKKAA
jgi:hypothetical protein